MQTETTTRALLYRRVSTDEQGLGLAAQQVALEAEAQRRGWAAELVTDEDVSGGTPAEERPALGRVLNTLAPRDVLVVAKLDRLSRSGLDFARLLRRAKAGGWGIVVLDLGVDMTTPNGRLVAHILAAAAEWEREMIGQRIREGLAQSDKTLGRVQPTGSWSRSAACPTPSSPQSRTCALRASHPGRSPKGSTPTATHRRAASGGTGDRFGGCSLGSTPRPPDRKRVAPSKF